MFGLEQCQRMLFAASIFLTLGVTAHWTDDLDLPPELLEYTVRNNKVLRKRCLEDNECPLDNSTLSNGRCWGFEEGCARKSSYSAERLKCNLPSDRQYVLDKYEKSYQLDRFYHQGDFGYIRSRNVMHTICISDSADKSTLSCADHLAYCTASNIFFDFKHLNAKDSKRYREDVIHNGDVGGNCDRFYPHVIEEQGDRQGYLQSWIDELRHFESLDAFKVDDDHCDVIFDRPTIVIKLDAAVNMFHHFCDFINLYASQFMNNTYFGKDVDILWWDTHAGGFVDTYFGATWRAFSDRPPTELISLDGKRVCFRQAVLPLLARQIYGMYYNMPVIDGCWGSGLMHAFSHHLIHRLRIEQHGPIPDKVRITILMRTTQYRRIVNIKQLLDRLSQLHNVEARVVDYNGQMPFLDQINSTHNSDIFIGMHGSGLTHLLFLPDWAAIFEIYNCQDAACYYDLARLRGVKYWTWQNESLLTMHGEGKHPTLGTPHRKFTNYAFDVDEFERIVRQMIEYVRRHPKFVEEQRKLRRLRNKKEL